MHDDNVLVSSGLTSILFRSIEVWLVISVAETVHGIARVTLLQPLVGDFAARQITVFTASLIIVAIALPGPPLDRGRRRESGFSPPGL